MKKITVLFLCITIPLFSFSQRFVDHDTIVITSSDTIVRAWFSNDYTTPVGVFGNIFSVEIQYDGINADDATFSIIGSNNAGGQRGYNLYNDADFPYTLNTSVTTRDSASHTFYDIKSPFIYLGYEFDGNSVSSDTVFIKFVRQ